MDMDSEHWNSAEHMTVALRRRATACLRAALARLEKGRPEPAIPHPEDAEAAADARAAATALDVLAQMWCENEADEDLNREPPVMGGPSYL
jgi:hypothetical protein